MGDSQHFHSKLNPSAVNLMHQDQILMGSPRFTSNLETTHPTAMHSNSFLTNRPPAVVLDQLSLRQDTNGIREAYNNIINERQHNREEITKNLNNSESRLSVTYIENTPVAIGEKPQFAEQPQTTTDYLA